MIVNSFHAELCDYDNFTNLAVRIRMPDGTERMQGVSVYRRDALTPWGMALGLRDLADWVDKQLGPAPSHQDIRVLLT